MRARQAEQGCLGRGHGGRLRGGTGPSVLSATSARPALEPPCSPATGPHPVPRPPSSQLGPSVLSPSLGAPTGLGSGVRPWIRLTLSSESPSGSCSWCLWGDGRAFTVFWCLVLLPCTCCHPLDSTSASPKPASHTRAHTHTHRRAHTHPPTLTQIHTHTQMPHVHIHTTCTALHTT